MAIRIITCKKISTQQNISDYIWTYTFEEIDLRATEGIQRYKEIFGCHPNSEGTNYRLPRKSRKNPSPPLEDVRFLSNTYNERDRRLFAGFLATSMGYGGVQKAAKLTNLDAKTVGRGKKEFNKRERLLKSRIRRQGGGRRSKPQAEPRYEKELEKIMEDEIAGDPMNWKKWTRKTLRWIKIELSSRGIDASISTIRKTLKSIGVSLKKNVKSKKTLNHPDRDAQFRHLNAKKSEFLENGNPTLSVDAKKKELIGPFKNEGRTLRKHPHEVLDHDFPSLAEGKLVPFGIYDLKANKGFVYCGTSFDTSEFAVDCIVRWWIEVGQKNYPKAKKILILCDNGGSNGSRRRLWKWELQTKLADRFGLAVHVCHYPTGASKYNPIEHRLFSFMSINWAGEPLTSFEKALEFINSTKTEKGLEVKAYLVDKIYQKGIKVSDEQMKSLNITYQGECPKWNYIIKPQR